MAGKTHARWYRLIVDGVDLSGDSRQVGSFGMEYATAEAQGWSDGVVWHTRGKPSHIFGGYQAVFNNTAATGSHIELSAIEEYIMSLAIGDKAAPVVGDPAWISTMEQLNYTVEGTDSVLVNIDAAHGLTNLAYPACFGRVLAPGTSLSATTDGTSVDNGASSANGALAHLHVLGSTSGDWALKIQDSANDSDWADLITFSSDGSGANTAETATVAGTVDRYSRFQATRTDGTTVFWVTFVRQ